MDRRIHSRGRRQPEYWLHRRNVPEHTLILLGASRLLADLLTHALEPAADVRVLIREGDAGPEAVQRALASEPEATVVALGACGGEAVAWRLTRVPLAGVSAADLLAAARRS